MSGAATIPMPAGAVPADGMGAGSGTPQTKTGAPVPMPAGAVSADDAQSAPPTSSPPQASFLENYMHPQGAPEGDENTSDLPLNSYGAATRSGFNWVANETLASIKGAAGLLHPMPQNEDEQTALNAQDVGGMLTYRIMTALSGMGAAMLHPHEVAAAIHGINNSQDPMGTYLKILQKTFATAAGQALTAVATEGLVKGAVAAKAPVSEAAGAAIDTARTTARDIVHGRDVAQPGAQAAVRTATGAPEGQPLIAGGKTVVDDVIGKLDTMRRDLYAQAKEKAGFDVQQAKEQLAAAKTRLKLTEGTDDTDIAEQAKQQVADLEEKISSAHDADPALLKAADQAHGKYAAAIQFRKALVAATDVDGTVNVGKLLTASKKLQFTKYGDQLSAFMGKDAAEEYMKRLKDMRDMGARAARTQDIAKWIATKIVPAGIAFEAARQVAGAFSDRASN